MMNAAAAFGAGVLAQHSLQATCASAPTCTAAPKEGGTSFKLSVRIHAASVPALGEQGRMVRLKLRLAVSLAGVEKETEDADFAGPARNSTWFTLKDESASTRSGCSTGCSSPSGAGGPVEWASWRFGDTLTFAVRTTDIIDGGLRLRLRVQSDVCLGPVQVQMPHSAQDLGEAVVDLRQRVFPVSVPSWSSTPFLGGMECEFQSQPLWETPALVFPLAQVCESALSGPEVNVQARAAISFTLNADPDVLMREVDEAKRPLPYKMAHQLIGCIHRGPVFPLALCSGDDAGEGDCEVAAFAAEARAWACSDSAVTPREEEQHQQQQQQQQFRQPQPPYYSAPVLPSKACSPGAYGLRKV
jgi:hypothetical protein